MEQQNTFNPGLAYSDYKALQVVYIVAALTAYFLSAYFVVGYFAGHLRILEWDGAQWAQAFPSAGLVAVMTAYQFFLYSNGDTEGGKKATWIAVAVAVAFSLLSEIGQGMERDSIRMETKSQESPTYKAAVAALGNLNGGNVGASPYAADIANAQMKYNQCMERLAKGKEPHCEGSKGRLASYQQQEAAWADRASTTSTNTATTLLDKAKTMEKDERNYHPLVNAFREFFGVSGTIGSFLLSLTLISFFEYAFHYLGGRYAKARAVLMHNGYDVTRKLRQPPRKHDGSVTTYSNGNTALPLTALDSAKMTVGEYAAKVEEGLKASPEVIATEYARAQHAREQVYSKAADKLDSIQDGLNKAAELKKADMPELKQADGFKQSPAQLAKVQELYQQQLHDSANGKSYHDDPYQRPKYAGSKNPANAGKTYREELRNGEKVYSDTPLDKPRPAPRFSVEQTVKQIQADVKVSGANTPDAIRAAVFNSFAAMQNPAPLDDAVLDKLADKLIIKQVHAPARPFHQQQGATGLQNPALGTAEEHYPLPLQRTAPDYQKGSEVVMQQPAQATAPDYQKGSEVVMQQPAQATAPDYQKGSEVVMQQPVQGATPDYQKGSDAVPAQDSIDRLYVIWRDAVRGGSISPAERPFTVLVRENADFDGVQNRQLKAIWDQFCGRAESEGVLMQNPHFVEGNRKAKYLIAA